MATVNRGHMLENMFCRLREENIVGTMAAMMRKYTMLKIRAKYSDMSNLRKGFYTLALFSAWVSFTVRTPPADFSRKIVGTQVPLHL